MKQSTFNKLFDQLNSEQQKAVENLDGVVMVIAGPGTGKTQVLTLRIANILLKTQTEPENILALTFTESGVTAMRKRLVSIIGPLAYRVNIFTFHGFANYIFQTYPEDFQDILGFQPITDLEQIEILENLFETLSFQHIKPINAPYFYLQASRQTISELKRENILPSDFALALKQQLIDFDQIDDLYNEKGRYKGQMKGKYKDLLKQIEKNQDLVKLYKEYQKKLKQLGYYDFDDMLIQLISQMEINRDLLLRLQERFQYFLVDEHQDTNKAQNRIVELLASYHPNPNLFAVGDERQAIYRFQGASLENFLLIRRLYPDAQVISLDQNYRSTQLILDASESLMHHNKLPEVNLPARNALRANLQETERKLKLVGLDSVQHEYDYIASEIETLIKSGTNPNQIAILSRTNRKLKEIMTILQSREVPATLYSNQNVLETLEARKILTLLRSVADLNNELFLLKALHIDFLGVHPLDIIKLQNQAYESKTSLWEILSNLKKSSYKDLDKLKHLAQKMLEWNVLSHNQTLDKVFVTILKESGALRSDLQKNSVQQVSSIYLSLYDQIKSKLNKTPSYSLSEFLSFIDLVTSHNLSLSTSTLSDSDQAVKLMTAHGSKGLEFERVFVIDALDSSWGRRRGPANLFKLPYEQLSIVSKGTLESDDKQADERRLFYVALTRAKYGIHITYAQNDLEGKEQIPSQFLSEVSETFFDKEAVVENLETQTKSLDQIFPGEPAFSHADADYLAQLKEEVTKSFDQHGLSATALNNYLSCPWKYFFRNVVKLPEEKSLALILGNAIHQVIHEYLINKKTVQTCNQVVDRYSELISRATLTSNEIDQLQQKGVEFLPTYFDQKMKNWPDDNKSELWISGVGLENEIKLRGKIDMLEHIKDSDYRVYDFKTGNPKSRNQILGNTKDSNGDYKRQLDFYKLLLDRYLGGRLHMVEGVLEFVQPTKSGTIKSEVFSISSEDTQALEEIIQAVAKEIRSLSFWNQRCDDPACEYCAIREMMK